MGETPLGIRELEALDRVFHALAHPTRRMILSVLQARGGEMSSGEIAERFECAWPTTTRHLGVLEQAGLVAVEAAGRERRYRLLDHELTRIAGGWVARFEPA